MAISLIQSKTGNGGGYVNTYTVTLTSNVTAGNFLVMSLTAGNTDTIGSISDNNSNGWSLAVTSANPTSGDRQTWLYYANNVAGGSTTVTVTFGAGDYVDSCVAIREYSGIATSSSLDVTSYNNDGSNYNNTHDAGVTGTTAQASELVILAGGAASNADPVFAAGSGYGNGLEALGYDVYTYGFISDNIVSTVGAQSGNFVSTNYVQGQALIATFKAAGGGPVVNKGAFFAVF